MKDLYSQLYGNRQTLEKIEMDPDRYQDKEEDEQSWDEYCESIYRAQKNITQA